MTPQVQKTIKRLSIVAFILMVAVLVISAVEQQENDLVKGVNIDITPLPDGHLLIDSMDVMTVINRSFDYELEKQRLGNVFVERIERVLEAEPFVFNAEVYIDRQDKVKIALNQREPILRIFDKNNQTYYLGKEGEKLPISKHFTTRSLVATGDIPPFDAKYMNPEWQGKKHVIRDLYELTQFILADNFWRALIEQVHVKEDEFVLIPKVGKQRILFGKFSDIDNKFIRLKTFYDEVMSRVGWTKYKEIDIRYKGQVIGR